MFADIVLGELIERQRPHGEPDDLITINLYLSNELSIVIMQVISTNKVIGQSSDIVLCQCSVNVTDEQLVAVRVEIDFSLQSNFL